MPPRKNNKVPPSIPFEHCTMSPAGVAALVELLRSQPLLQDVDDAHLYAMAIAYLASGGATDNSHNVQSNGFHRAHTEAHSSTALFNWREDLRPNFITTIMDMLTWLDRLSGGGTLLLHAPGTRPPNSPAAVDEVKLDVFIPLNALRNDPDCRIAVTRIIQHFAENVGLPIMLMWDRGKSLNVGGRIYTATPRAATNRNAYQPVMPPLTGPALTFFGRAPGTLEALLAQELGGAVGLPIVPATPSTPPATPSAAPITLPAAPPSTPTSSRGAASSCIPLAFVKMEDTSVATPTTRRTPNIASLEARIVELETIIRAQGEEINDLRAMVAAERSSQPPHGAPYTSRSANSSSATFGRGKGKESASRDQFPTSPSLHSYSSVSSVSSVTSSSQPSSPTPGARGNTPSCMLANMRLVHGPQSNPGPSRSRTSRAHESDDGEGDEGLTIRYGFFTDRIIASHHLPDETFEQLHAVHINYAVGDWMEGILADIPNITKQIAQQLADAMRYDWGLL